MKKLIKALKNLKLFYCYLAGPIEADTEDGGKKWRDSITPSLDKVGIYVQDPCKTEPLATGMDVIEAQDQFNRWIQGGRYDLFANKFSLLVDKDLKMVNRSDFIIVHLFPNIGTTGTIHEMARAWRLKVPIYLIYYGAISKISKWALFLTTNSGGKVFQNRKQCTDFIEARYDMKILGLSAKISQVFKALFRLIEVTLYERKMEKRKIKNETTEEREKRLKLEEDAKIELTNRKDEWPNGQAITGKE